MDVGSPEKGHDNSYKENNKDQFSKEIDQNLLNEDNFISDTLFQNDNNFDSNFTPNPLKETKEEEQQPFLMEQGESAVSDAFDLYNSNGALEAAYEEMRNELMRNFDMDFVRPTLGTEESNANNNNNNNMCENIYMDQEVGLLDVARMSDKPLNDTPQPDKNLNNNTTCFEKEKPEFLSKKDEEIQHGINSPERMVFEKKEEKSPLNGDDNKEANIRDQPHNNIYIDQEMNLLDVPKISNQIRNDIPSPKKTLNNSTTCFERVKPKFPSNKDEEDEKSEEKKSPLSGDDDEEEVDIMDSNENGSSIEGEGGQDEDILEIKIPQVRALNGGPSPHKRENSRSRSQSREKQDDHRRRKRSKSRSRSSSKSRSREKLHRKSRKRAASPDRRSASPATLRRRKVSPRRRRMRSRSPISLRDLRHRSPRRRSPRRRFPPRPVPRRSSPARRRRPPSPPPVRQSTGFGQPGKNLYVTGFSFDTSEADLERKFSKFGHVRGTRIVRDRSGDSRGYGFLSMDTDLEADEAIRALDGKVWNNKILVVEKTKSSQRI